MSDLSISGASQPFPRVQNAINRDVASGAISATDQTALTAAIGDISAQLAATATAATSSTGSGATTGASAAPTSMRDRVNSLIDDEVSSGKLTSDQASELKGAFAQAQTQMHAGHGAHGAHGHHGGGGGIEALLGTDSTDATDPTTATGATTATDTTTATSSLQAAATNAVNALDAFITQFKAAVSSNGLYGAGGANASASPAMLINSIG